MAGGDGSARIHTGVCTGFWLALVAGLRGVQVQMRACDAEMAMSATFVSVAS